MRRGLKRCVARNQRPIDDASMPTFAMASAPYWLIPTPCPNPAPARVNDAGGDVGFAVASEAPRVDATRAVAATQTVSSAERVLRAVRPAVLTIGVLPGEVSSHRRPAATHCSFGSSLTRPIGHTRHRHARKSEPSVPLVRRTKADLKPAYHDGTRRPASSWPISP